MKFASLVSIITEPMFLVIFIAAAGGYQAGVRGILYGWYIIYLLGLSLIIWLARLRFMKSMHTNWDVSDRVKRVRLLLLLLGFSAFIFLSVYVFHIPALSRFVFGLVLWLIGFFLITLKAKISGHMAIATLAVGWFWPMVFFLPFIGWSRLVLKRHTLVEVILGAVYSGIFV